MIRLLIHTNDLVLFQGDSITDAGRNREISEDLAGGYAGKAAALFRARHPELGVRFLNRGISGDRSSDMLNRWQTDCIDCKPDVISIMIGINDTWRRYDSGLPTTAKEYADNLESALRQAKETGARIVVISPYLLPAEDKAHWRAEDLDDKQAACKALAEQYADAYLPMDDIFREYLASHPDADCSPDGVHPNDLGAQIIAEHWVELVEQA